MPPSSTLKVFAHRFNADRTADSICLYCFATVGSTLTELELEGAEATHICRQRAASSNRGRPYLVAKQKRPSNSAE